MSEYTEKRDHFRMTMGCEIELRHGDKGTIETAMLVDLSATGMRFLIDSRLDEGTVLEVSLTPANDITPPMQARIEVLRCTPSDDQRFDVAAAIDAVEPAAYPEAGLAQ